MEHIETHLTAITQPRTTAQKQQLSVALPGHVTISQDQAGQKALAVELYQRFQASKTYGKDPEALDSIIAVFVRDLAEYPIEKVMQAVKTHSERSPEFPTVADIVGLIKRNGRREIKESDIIAIRRKDGEDRTRQDWDMLRQWEEQLSEGWATGIDVKTEESHRIENNRLRQQVRELKAEIARLNELLFAKRKPMEQPKITTEQRIENTVTMMRETGSTQEQINEFIQSMRAA